LGDKKVVGVFVRFCYSQFIPRCAVIPFIGWIKKHNNEFENAFVQIEAFISYLNESCFRITDYEFHYSLYEKVTFTCNM
jgi:hypothetical protein